MSLSLNELNIAQEYFGASLNLELAEKQPQLPTGIGMGLSGALAQIIGP